MSVCRHCPSYHVIQELQTATHCFGWWKEGPFRFSLLCAILKLVIGLYLFNETKPGMSFKITNIVLQTPAGCIFVSLCRQVLLLVILCVHNRFHVYSYPFCIWWGLKASGRYFQVSTSVCLSLQGYGDNKPRSSTQPQELKTLDGVYIHSVACGYGHSLFIARADSDQEKEKIEQLPSFTPWAREC